MPFLARWVSVRRVSDAEAPLQPRRPGGSADQVACFGCGAHVQSTDGPTNANIGGSPGCQAVYEKVRSRGMGDPRYAEFQQLAMLTYSAQHPAVTKHGSTQSVAPQLIGLCALLERGLPVSVAIRAVGHAVKSRDSFEHLSQPESSGELTVLHVRDATTLQEHIRRVREWSSSVWNAWSPHHPVIRKWTAEAIRRVQPPKAAAPHSTRTGTRPVNNL